MRFNLDSRQGTEYMILNGTIHTERETDSLMPAAAPSAFELALRDAAAKRGCDISGLHALPVCLDNTWGHLMGWAFFGPAEITERAAQFCLGWHQKGGSGSYAAQSNIMDRGTRSVYVSVNDARKLGFEPPHKYGSYQVTARCVSTVYYPDAD
jgi:hypothetical protein